jgi:hypothetical protein
MSSHVNPAAPERLSVPKWAPTPTTSLTSAQRDTLHRVANQLIPAAGDNPAGSDAPGYDRWLDRCIAARRDAVDLLVTTLDQLGHEDDLDQALRRLHADDSEGRFHLVSSIVAGAYLAGDEIRRLIGYPGQFREAAKIDDAANDLADGILEPVLKRGYIYVSAAGE